MDAGPGMDGELEARRQRLERRCRLWLFGGYGLILAGMAGLVWLPLQQRPAAWAVILLGAAARVMYYLDHAALRTLRKIAQERRREAGRHGAGMAGAHDAKD